VRRTGTRNARSARTALATSALLALTLTACGSGEDDPTVAEPGGSSTTAGPGAGATPSSGGGGIAPGATLNAMVGTKDSPEAFEISLTDASGAPVTQLPAGKYTIKVVDESKIHNFALKGEDLEMATDVGGKESPTWDVDLKAGDYTFTCDPHPSMSGSFVVT
jgi:plastocyanin